jgi:FkbM family methyltransferase
MGVTSQIELRPGWVIRSHPAAYRLAYRAQREDPEQIAEFDHFLRCCHPGMFLFDIGAHFGLFGLAATHYGGPNARAVAVDPSPLAARVLQAQTGLNGVTDRLQVVQASVGERSGLHSDFVAAGIGSAGYFVPATPDHPRVERTRVEMVTVDELAVKFGQPTHIKIDVEGYEGAVLRGGSSTFGSKTGPMIFLELHSAMIQGAGGNPAEPLDLLEAYQYRIFDIEDQLADKEKIIRQPLTRLFATK